MYSRKDIAGATGLSMSFIHKAMRRLTPIFAPYSRRGENNAELLDSNGMAIFQQIASMKQEGRTLPDIADELEKAGLGGGGQGAEGSTHTVANHRETALLREWLEETKRERDQARKELEARRIKDEAQAKELEELRRTLNNLEGQVKALPADPETMEELWRKEQERKKEVAKLTAELAGLGPFAFRKRKRLLAELRELVGGLSKP